MNLVINLAVYLTHSCVHLVILHWKAFIRAQAKPVSLPFVRSSL